MTLDYYYGDQAEQFSFYRIPKVLFTDKRFKDISAEAKILYGLLLDRMSLSAKNGWLDQVGRVYIVYTVEDIMDALSCASQKAMKLLNELDDKCGLIERKRQGLGKPNLIYVKNFVATPESKFKNGENQNSGLLKIETQEFPKSKGSNTEKNNTDYSDTESLPFPSFRDGQKWESKGTDAERRAQYRGLIMENTTQELFQTGKEALYCGINALSNNLIMVDRKLLKNPNGLILGTPGSGKSFSAKREIANVFLVTDDDIIICDPEAEYGPLVEHLHGQVIKISPTSTDYINPMDLNLNYSDDENPLSLKSDFILSLCELIVGGKDGLMPVEKTIIDRCVRLVYRNYLNDPRPENMPILGDLYEELRKQDEKEAQYIATALEIYVTGSLNVFNHQTNVDVHSRVVAYDIKELGKQLKKIGMLIVQDQVWNRVTVNREAHKSTRYYIDEMHLLLKEEQTASYTIEIWKRFRKWGGMPTGITQNVKDLLSSREVENIFENSDYIYMLNQASGDRQILAKQLNISPHQLSYVTHSGEGEGLLFYGNIILPFVDRFPKDTELYRVLTTKPQEVSS